MDALQYLVMPSHLIMCKHLLALNCHVIDCFYFLITMGTHCILLKKMFLSWSPYSAASSLDVVLFFVKHSEKSFTLIKMSSQFLYSFMW